VSELRGKKINYPEEKNIKKTRMGGEKERKKEREFDQGCDEALTNVILKSHAARKKRI